MDRVVALEDALVGLEARLAKMKAKTGKANGRARPVVKAKSKKR